MSKKRTPPSLRTLVLALNLLNTRQGLTQAQLLALVPGYSGPRKDSVRRTFERDLAVLRDSGLNIEVSVEATPRYRISSDSSDRGPVVLDQPAARLLLRAARAWRDSSNGSDALVNKILGLSRDAFDAPPMPADLNLEGSPVAAKIGAAIASARPIGFEYASRSGREYREVAPWRLAARGRALYLWGFDLNRWAPRLFRLSRFRSAPDLLAEPGTVPATGPLQEAAFSSQRFLLSPLLLVREGAAPLTRARSERLSQSSSESFNESFSESASETVADSEDWRANIPAGWQLRRGRTDDMAAWEVAVLREADDVIALEPADFANRLRANLQAAAGATHG